MDLINLFIHEAGHFFFKIFGRTLYFLGGSIMQVILPFLLFIATIKKNKYQAILPAYWLGESLINVSVYIKDAPYRELKLIAKGLTHDWNWILKKNLELANPIATLVFIIGTIFCAYTIIMGVSLLFQIYRRS